MSLDALSEAAASPRRRIAPLPQLVVDQIAAGEVVERPASVVKELVENALDAGARRIIVELEQGGIELVRVSDDGCGIPAADLALAVAPHATSKLRGASDLERVATLGFRGEALASIASVSRLSLRSRTGEEQGASVIEVEGGRSSEVRPTAGAPGTAVAVRNLFFNTPARRKFLRTPGTEQARCVDLVRTLALAHPAVGFELRADGRTLIDLPPEQSVRDRALDVLGRELERELLELGRIGPEPPPGVAIWGLAGRPGVSRASRTAQHLFVNGRAVADRTLQHAVREAYRGLIDPTRHPLVVVMLELPPESVDVNVHPAKAEVRFRDQGLVHSVVLGAVREALRAADLTPSVASSRFAGATPEARVSSFVEYFSRQVPAQAGGRFSYEAVRSAVEAADASVGSVERAQPEQTPPPMAAPRPVDRALQVHNSYIVTQDEEGVVIIDQHALHERVMFELLLERVSAGPLESQRLLTPIVVEAPAERVARLSDLGPLLERIGVDASPLGPRSVGIHAFPTFLFERGVEAGPFMEDLLHRAEEEGFAPDGEEALRDVLDMMACKAAVKAGDRLTEPELGALLDLRGDVERSSSCPNGRPTSIRLTIRDLERLFGRS